jgi:hypothetical protein
MLGMGTVDMGRYLPIGPGSSQEEEGAPHVEKGRKEVVNTKEAAVIVKEGVGNTWEEESTVPGTVVGTVGGNEEDTMAGNKMKAGIPPGTYPQ